MAFDDQSEEPDEALIVRYANGDPDAARVLTARLAPAVLAHAHRVLGSRAEAEDVTQEAMLRLWRFAPDWRPGGARLRTWLFRVTVNLCRSLPTVLRTPKRRCRTMRAPQRCRRRCSGCPSARDRRSCCAT